MACYKYILNLFIITLLLSINANAHADALTYRDVVADTLRHSPLLQMKVVDIKISAAQYKTSFAGLLPSVNLSGRAERYENLAANTSSNIETIGNEVVGGYQSAWRSSVSLTGQYYFSNWYKKRYETHYYEKMKESSVHQCEAEAKKIIREVTDIYSSLVEAGIKCDYSEKILVELETILKIKKEAYAVGQYSFEEVLKAEADVTTVEREWVKDKKELIDQCHRLSGYTGLNCSEKIAVEPMPVRGAAGIEDESKAVLASPEYRMRLKEMDAIHAKTTAARNSLLPDISVYARYDLFNSSPENLNASIRETEPTSYSVGVLVSLPLFDGGAKYWEWKKNLYEKRKQEENIRATMEENKKNIKTLSDGYNNLTKSYQHFKKLSDQYERMTSISKKAQALGERSLLDSLELKKDALTVERDLKIMENTLAVYERQMALEIDFNQFVRDYDGNWACSD